MRPTALAIALGLAERVVDESTRYAPRETGGVLLGHRGSDAAPAVVTELVGAGPAAQREDHRFTPDGPWQRARIAERYEASGRTLDYLGDWHSHPRGNGPSPLDRSTARAIASARAARCPHPIFLIVTRGEEDWELRGYWFARRRFRRVPVEVP